MKSIHNSMRRKSWSPVQKLKNCSKPTININLSHLNWMKSWNIWSVSISWRTDIQGWTSTIRSICCSINLPQPIRGCWELQQLMRQQVMLLNSLVRWQLKTKVNRLKELSWKVSRQRLWAVSKQKLWAVSKQKLWAVSKLRYQLKMSLQSLVINCPMTCSINTSSLKFNRETSIWSLLLVKSYSSINKNRGLRFPSKNTLFNYWKKPLKSANIHTTLL